MAVDIWTELEMGQRTGFQEQMSDCWVELRAVIIVLRETSNSLINACCLAISHHLRWHLSKCLHSVSLVGDHEPCCNLFFSSVYCDIPEKSLANVHLECNVSHTIEDKILHGTRATWWINLRWGKLLLRLILVLLLRTIAMIDVLNRHSPYVTAAWPENHTLLCVTSVQAGHHVPVCIWMNRWKI